MSISTGLSVTYFGENLKSLVIFEGSFSIGQNLSQLW